MHGGDPNASVMLLKTKGNEQPYEAAPTSAMYYKLLFTDSVNSSLKYITLLLPVLWIRGTREKKLKYVILFIPEEISMNYVFTRNEILEWKSSPKALSTAVVTIIVM